MPFQGLVLVAVERRRLEHRVLDTIVPLSLPPLPPLRSPPPRLLLLHQDTCRRLQENLRPCHV